MNEVAFVSRLAVLASFLFCAVSAYASSETAAGKRIIDPFDYKGVSLDGGSMRVQLDEVRDYYLRVPNDDFLKGFRARAGLPSPGVDLGGWYSDDCFSVFGQVISGFSRMYAATGDPACKEKADCLISEWAKCIEPDGFFFYSRKPNAPHYVYDKMVCGLLDAYLYCGDADALKHLSRITDWAENNLQRTNVPPDREWYTLSENLYRAYLATGNSRYRDFARVWEYTDYWNAYLGKTDASRIVGRHAYSHVNTLSGAGAAYLATGEKHYLDTLKNAYDYLQEQQVFATGGYGPDESLLSPDKLRARLYSTANTFEVQCGSWAAFKMAKYLMSFTGDARYGDWVERLVINGIGASIPMSPDGKVFYYADYNPGGGEKREHPVGWACCAGTRLQAVADYCDLVFFRDDAGIYVNLFTPSTANWNHAGSRLTLVQRTRFPEEETVELAVAASKPSEFSINVRVPGWLEGPMTAKLNGKPVDVRANKLHWASFKRDWKDGDRLSIRLPMRFWSARVPASSDKQFPTAVLRGPVVLAFRTQGRSPARQIDFADLDKSFISSPGEPLTYHLAADLSVLVRPFYAFKAGERYFMYMDPDYMFLSISHAQLTYSDGWQNFGGMHATRQPGSSAEYAFEGTGIRWIARRYDDAGKAEVIIDGKVVDTVDLYDPGRDVPWKWEKAGLAPGKHVIGIRLLDDKNPASKDHYINIIGLEVL